MHDSSPEGPVRRWLSTIPVLVLLGGTALHWMAQEASGQLISVGESIWPGYAIHLRVKAEEPAPALLGMLAYIRPPSTKKTT